MATAKQTRKIIAISLVAGVKPSEIAAENNISQSYINNLLQDDAFTALMLEYQGKDSEAAEKRDSVIDAIQDDILEVIKNNVPVYAKNSTEALKLFKVMNEAKKSNTGVKTVINNIKVVQLPKFLLERTESVPHKLNENNEVIEVDGRALITQSSDQLLTTINDREQEKIINRVEQKKEITMYTDNLAESVDFTEGF